MLNYPFKLGKGALTLKLNFPSDAALSTFTPVKNPLG